MEFYEDLVSKTMNNIILLLVVVLFFPLVGIRAETNTINQFSKLVTAILIVDVVYKLVLMFDSLHYYVIACVDSINMSV